MTTSLASGNVRPVVLGTGADGRSLVTDDGPAPVVHTLPSAPRLRDH